MKPKARRISIAAAVVAAPDLALAATFLLAWVDPTLLPAWVPGYLLAIMLLEFIIIHSSGFMAAVYVSRDSRLERVGSLAALGLAYTFCIWLVAARLDAAWLYGAFWLLTLNKIAGVLLGQADVGRERDFVIDGWLVAVVLFGATLFLSKAFPVPALGTSLLESQIVVLPRSLFNAEPQRFLAWGFAYFSLLALSEVTNHAWWDGVGARVGSWAWGSLHRKP